MWEYITYLFDWQSFMPHGHCYFWQPSILWTHVFSDAVIGAAYLSIPVALLTLIHRRKDLAFNWMFLLFGLFILACGATHIMNIVTVWIPAYRLDGALKVITAVASIGTALALWPLIPRALALPSPAQLASVNRKLAAENNERLRAEAALAKQNRSLIEAERLKSEFIANISHELRTPLTLILSPLEVLQASGREWNEDEQHALRSMHNNAIRLLQMVNGLLDFSKAEAGQIEIIREPVDIVALTRAILADFQPMIDSKGLALEFTTNRDAMSILMDRYLYERIVFNLMSNAAKFSRDDGRIHVELAWERERLRLCVQDEGIGIAPADLSGIFQKFRQVDSSSVRRFDGTGLGLAMVKEFSVLLQGDVEVTSELGRGSTFTVDVYAPVANTVAPPMGVRDARPATVLPVKFTPVAPEQSTDTGLPKVLIAEDNGELAGHIASVLRPTCHTALALDGQEALRRAREWCPDLILSDVMMPRRDGLSLCRDIKADPELAHIPVVLLTAQTQREALLKGWNAGADEYLFKPFHPKELLTRVNAILAATRHRRRAEEAARRYAAQMEDVNRELEAFSYSVSHDVRAPLRRIESFSEILEQEYSDALPENAKALLSRVRKNAQQGNQIVKALLELSRLSRKPLNTSQIALPEMIEETLSELSQDMESREIDVVVGELPPCLADPSLLRQVFTNLLSNAIKYSRPGERTHIEIGARLEEESVVYYVTDNGVGFDMKYADKLFAPFQRLHSADEYEGSGVGLALVQRIITRHGGRVWAEATPGMGATFYFSLPVRRENGPDHQLASAACIGVRA
jgi:signal transduction histidine kinase